MKQPELLSEIIQDEAPPHPQPDHAIHVCVAAGCLTAHSDRVKAALEVELEKHHRDRECQVRGVGCMGLCSGAPMVAVEPQGVLYQKVAPDDTSAIVKSLEKSPVRRLECGINVSFFQKQQKIVLENAGKIAPDSIEDYLACGGYQALRKALYTLTPDGVIDEVMTSQLRGRGGAGYPTGLKWAVTAKARSSEKYVICNADEGDPGAFVDRTILESDPQRVIEGMILAGYAIGASRGYIYIRAEYPLATRFLTIALAQAEELGYLGNNVLDTNFNFHIELRVGAGAYVCGEETALIASIEGKRGTPHVRPPYPSESGLWGRPTIINNVETLANIPSIIRNGGAWFAGIGTPKGKGTKVFSITGHVKNTGVIEVPMGMSLREIIYDIAGGPLEGHHIKAVQTGGPTGGCIPEANFDTPVDYDSFSKLGSIIGSGGMIVMDETACMVDLAKYFMSFCMAESCGQCVPCRVGTAHMYSLLEKITDGNATLDDLTMLEEMSTVIKQTSLCGLGQSAPNPVLSTLRHFRDEYLEHIVDHTCRAHVCSIREAVL